jgi:hypothetical protein
MPATTALAGPSLAESAVLRGPNFVRAAEPLLRRHLLIAIVATMCLFSALMHRAELRIDPRQLGNVPFYVVGVVLMGLRLWLPRSAWPHAAVATRFVEYIGLFTFITLIAAALSYPVTALTHGYADVPLQAVDEALGFDWLRWYRLVAEHPVLQLLGTIAYRSIYVTPIVLLWHAARAGDQDRAYRFMTVFWVAAMMTLAVFTLMPAVGPFSHLWHGAIPYMPESEQWQSGLIPALREHAVRVVDLGQIRGIVSAPSFHTVAAVLYIVAAWRIEALRWPVLAVNAAMLLSTPVEGTHYLIDMILGAFVALAALAFVEFYERKLAQRAR